MLVMTTAGQRLNADAAAAYERLNTAFQARFGKRLNISSGARTYQEQVTIFTTNFQLTPIRWSNGNYITKTWQGRTWYLRPGYAIAAVPGTSNHEYPPGRAADFGSGVQTRYSAEHNWMLQNAGAYGWVWTGKDFATVEPWHWEAMGTGSGAGESEEDEMSAAAEQAIFNIEKILGAQGAQNVNIKAEDTVLSMTRQTRDVLGAVGGANLPTEFTVLANIRALVAMCAGIQLNTQNANAYLFAGGPGVDNTIGAPNSIFGLLLSLSGRTTSDIDEEQLAREISTGLIPAVVAAVGAGSITVDQLKTELATLPAAVRAELAAGLAKE